jgi:RNA polymerase sigma factor (sigma-70 family)
LLRSKGLIMARDCGPVTMRDDSAKPLRDDPTWAEADDPTLQSGIRPRFDAPRPRDSMARYMADLDRADRITPEQERSIARAFADAATECLLVAQELEMALGTDPGRSSRDDVVRAATRLWRMLDEHAEASDNPRRRALARVVEEELGASAETLARVREAMAETRAEAMRLRGVMTRANLGLVVYVAKSYNHRGVPLGDLIQEGNIALMHAVERFDPDRGFRLSTYATAWLRRSMQRTVRSLSRTVRLPESARGAKSRSVPIDEPIGPARISLTDILIEPEALAPDDVAAREQIRARARDHLGDLRSKEAYVIRRRFGIGEHDPMTLREIGEELGITRERVRQIEKAALDKLRRRMRPLAAE